MKKLISFFKSTRPSQLLIGSLLGVVFSVSAAYSFTKIRWSDAAPSPVGRAEAQGAVLDGKLYVFGGTGSDGRCHVYNPANNSWRQIADLPVRNLTHAGTAVDGRNIYLAGGYVNKAGGGVIFAIADVLKYNVDTNEWTRMPPLPVARGSGGMEVLNGKLHFFGGTDIRRADHSEHWALSLNGGTSWIRAAPLPQVRNHMGDVVLGGKLYAIGGQVTQEHTGAQASMYRWNPATDDWTTVAPLPRARSHTSAATFVMGDRIVVIGGYAASGGAVSDITAYDPLSNSWTSLTPLPAPRASGVAAYIGGQIFYTTGNGILKTTYKGVPVLTEP